jgi:hypothetical protein
LPTETEEEYQVWLKDFLEKVEERKKLHREHAEIIRQKNRTAQIRYEKKVWEREQRRARRAARRGQTTQEDDRRTFVEMMMRRRHKKIAPKGVNWGRDGF